MLKRKIFVKTHRIFSAIVALVMVVMCSGTVSYADISPTPCSLSEETMDAALVTRGYPQVVLDSMNPKAKESIYNNSDLTFNAACMIVYDGETGQSQDYAVQAGQPISFGQIPTSDLGLAWVVSDDGENYLNVQFSYEWYSTPVFRFQDPIALSWDSSKFAMVDDTFEKTDYYDDYIINPVTGETTISYENIQSHETGYARGSDDGVVWYADLKGGLSIANLYGEASVTLEKLTSASGTSRMYGYYVHPTVSPGISVDIYGYGDFTVAHSGYYDECTV